MSDTGRRSAITDGIYASCSILLEPATDSDYDLNVVILLVIFYILDTRAYRKDLAEGIVPEVAKVRKRQSVS